MMRLVRATGDWLVASIIVSYNIQMQSELRGYTWKPPAHGIDIQSGEVTVVGNEYAAL